MVFVVVVFLHAHSSGMNVLRSADCVSTKTIKKKMMKEIHVGFRRVLGAWPEVCVSTPYTRVSPVFYFFFRSLIDLVNFRKKMAWVFQTPTQLLYFLTILYIVPHHHHIPTLLTLAFFSGFAHEDCSTRPKKILRDCDHSAGRRPLQRCAKKKMEEEVESETNFGRVPTDHGCHVSGQHSVSGHPA